MQIAKDELNIEAIKIELEGMPNYKVKYRVYIQNIGWQEWKTNGQTAGLINGTGIEAIEIKLMKS